MRQFDRPDALERRLTGLRMTALQVDPDWYEKHWLTDRPAPRPIIPVHLARATSRAAWGFAVRIGHAVRRLSGAAPGQTPDLARR